MRPLLKLLLRERILPFLVLSISLVAWQHWGMATVRAIEPSDFQAVTSDDRPDGGASVCKIDPSRTMWSLWYDIRPGVSWAFCGMHIDLVDPTTGHGIDFSDYDTLVIFLERASGPNDLFQIQLLSMDSAVYRPEEPMTIKFLTMDLIPPPGPQRRHALPLAFFSVPGWWAARNHIRTELQAPIRDNVQAIEVLTGNGKVPYGNGEVAISRFELHGKWIRQETLVRLLLVGWIAYALALMGIRLVCSLQRERNLRMEASRFQELAGRDPLTGVLNRRGFEDAFKSLLACRGPGAALGVLMLDLDLFKRINDTMGHHAGDEILRQLARILRSHMRDGDLCCRYGGEEFMLAVPGITSTRLQILAEKLREAIEQGVACNGRPVTASLGISGGTMEEFASLVQRADDALYKAKSAGRNRVEEA